MRTVINYIGVLVLFSTTCHASSGFYTGNDLTKLCNTLETEQHYFANNAQCHGYVAGVVDVVVQLDAYDDALCIPSAVTVGQVTKVVKKFMADNPAELHWLGFKIVSYAMLDAFPCE